MRIFNSYRNLPQYRVVAINAAEKVYWAFQMCRPGQQGFQNMAICEKRGQAMHYYKLAVTELEATFKDIKIN